MGTGRFQPPTADESYPGTGHWASCMMSFTCCDHDLQSQKAVNCMSDLCLVSCHVAWTHRGQSAGDCRQIVSKSLRGWVSICAVLLTRGETRTLLSLVSIFFSLRLSEGEQTSMEGRLLRWPTNDSCLLMFNSMYDPLPWGVGRVGPRYPLL